MPFDRLVRTVDRWAGANRSVECFAQVGPGGVTPWNMRSVEFLSPDEFDELVDKAQLVIAHAGMGSIIKALVSGKPILVMPRRGSQLETRNDHQFATAAKLAEEGLIDVAIDEDELTRKLNSLQTLRPHRRITDRAQDELIHALRDFAFSPIT